MEHTHIFLYLRQIERTVNFTDKNMKHMKRSGTHDR